MSGEVPTRLLLLTSCQITNETLGLLDFHVLLQGNYGVAFDELFPPNTPQLVEKKKSPVIFLLKILLPLHAPKHLFAVIDKAFNTKLDLLTGWDFDIHHTYCQGRRKPLGKRIVGSVIL